MEFNSLFEPIRIGGMEVRNRFVVPPQGSNLANDDGTVSQLMVDFYEERAKGGFGLVIIEVTAVAPEGKAVIRQVGLWSDEHIEGFRKLSDAIHKHGAKIAAQIHHAGRAAPSIYNNGQQPVSCSPIPCLGNPVTPRALTTEETYEMIDLFVQAAVRLKKAGADAVELHGAHLYLISQFMSNYSNRRTDEFGGSFNNRMRFPRLIIQGIRRQLGNDFPILFRLSADEHARGGREIMETITVCKEMVKAGANAVDISSGSNTGGHWSLPPNESPLATFAHLADEVKRSVSVPVIGVGRINDPHIAEMLIESGRMDMVAIGRQSIADPHFPNKVMVGELDEISPCIACNQGCIGDLFMELGLTCAINPFSGRGTNMRPKPAEKAKKVLVVGGGPGGMQCAWVLAKRGHDVTLLEKANDLGGQFLIASYAPGKGDIVKAIRYYRYMCEKYGVKIRMGTEATADLIKAEKPDAVVLATGGEQLVPDIKGACNPAIMQACDVLAGKVITGSKVLVAGGGLTGIEAADYLAQYGNEVTVVEMRDAVAPEANAFSVGTMLQHVRESGTKIMLGTKILEFFDDGILAEQGGKEISLRGFGAVVLALGAKSYNPLEEEVKALVDEVYVIGDAIEPGMVGKATEKASVIALKI